MTNDKLMQLKARALEISTDGGNWTMEIGSKPLLALIAKVESLAADAERLDQLEKIIGRNDCGPHIYSHGRCYEGETMREVLDLVIAKEKA